MKRLFHSILDWWDKLSSEFKCGAIYTLVVFSIISFAFGAINANKQRYGHCEINTRAGQSNLPYRFGCYMFGEIKE